MIIKGIKKIKAEIRKRYKETEINITDLSKDYDFARPTIGVWVKDLKAERDKLLSLAVKFPNIAKEWHPTKNGDTTTFYTVGSSAIYDDATMLPTTDFWSGSFSVTGNYNSERIGWDVIAPSGGAEEGQLDTLGFGKYKFYTSTSGGPHFYYNLCDCRYVEMGNTDYPTHDLALKYDGSVKTFSYKPWGSTGGYTTITNGETIDIWNALGAGGQPSTDCFLSSFTPSNLSLSYVNNKPKLAWSIEHPDTNGVYKIYRSVWENGDYSGQTAVWPPVVTVNSWTDEDFTRFRFGNYTIDYEVAYLSLPPNESEKSNQVTTTTGNWSGPLGKTRADKYTLNIFPNPFNSSVTIPLNEEIHTVSIYNILGETIKKYSHVDLISKNQIVWNGLDKYGNEVSTGTYFVILVSDNKIQTRKVVFAK